jgi:predicted nicotinamide N-methyase
MFILVNDVPYEVDTEEELQIAKEALREQGVEVTTVYAGDPDCPDAYLTSFAVYAAEGEP